MRLSEKGITRQQMDLTGLVGPLGGEIVEWYPKVSIAGRLIR